MDDEEYIEGRRQDLKDSVEFFSPRNKGEREMWVAKTFVENLNMPHAEAELALSADDPPDVSFRDARFEIKEILDPGRRRHDEYRAAYEKALAATTPSDLLTEFTPRHITLEKLYELVLDASLEHQRKYAPAVCKGLDLLFYVNLQDVMGLIEAPFPDTAALRSHSWRSVSFVMGLRACVLTATPGAPAFLQAVVAQFVHRANPEQPGT